jgi:hypothetical protein
VLEQQALERQPAAEADQRPVGADDAMAREDDRQRVAAVGRPDRAHGPRAAEPPCLLPVADRRPEGDVGERVPRGDLELGPDGVER